MCRLEASAVVSTSLIGDLRAMDNAGNAAMQLPPPHETRGRQERHSSPVQMVAGVRMSASDLRQTVDIATGLVHDTRGHAIFTCNVDHLVQLSQNEDFAAAYQRASLVTADGAPVVALARLLGGPVRQRVTGADLVPAVAAQAEELGIQMILVGGAEGVADKARDKLRDQHPGLTVVSVPPPPLGFSIGGSDDDQLLRHLQQLGPGVIVVCFGAPKQELWIAHHLDELPGSVLVGAGATIDFLAGVQRRAPQVWQRLGAEFAWRLMRDWRRLWRRYLIQDSHFVLIAIAEIVRHRSGRHKAKSAN